MKEHQTRPEPQATTQALPARRSRKKPRAESNIDPYEFGGCPKCCRWDDCVPVGSEEWVVCYQHRTKFMWAAGGGSWADAEGVEPGNPTSLERFREVEPAYPAMSPDDAAALLRLADAACNENLQPEDPDHGKAHKEQLAADAKLVRQWVAANRTTWIQYIHVNDDENRLVKGADER